jgi:hypothetical protein
MNTLQICGSSPADGTRRNDHVARSTSPPPVTPGTHRYDWCAWQRSVFDAVR